MNKLTYLTKNRYMDLVKKLEGGHWTPATIDQRWEYHSRAVELVRSLNINRPQDVLEMGTMGVSCVNDSDTIDYTERWDFPGKRPTYIHDSRIIPWPVHDKQYEIFIALRVFQHLTPFQREATREVMRIARRAIIVVPEVYANKEIPDSKGITYKDFVEFLDGLHPNLYFPTRDEYVYYWDFDNPSTLNLESVMRRSGKEGSPVLLSPPQMERDILTKTKNVAKRMVNKTLTVAQSIIRPGRVGDSGRKIPSRHVEFIGPAGIGKSTIFEEVKNHVVGNWKGRGDLHIVLEKHEYGHDAEDYLGLLQNKISHLEKYALPDYEKIRLTWFFSDILLKDMAIMNNSISSSKFMLDEGLCHNFSEELMRLSDSSFEMLMANRAFIFVQARRVETVVERIRKRENEAGRLVAYHMGLNNEELKKYIEQVYSGFNAFIERVEALDIPVCKIFAEDETQTRVGRILDFEKSILDLL